MPMDEIAAAIVKLSPDEAAFFLHKLEAANRKRRVQGLGADDDFRDDVLRVLAARRVRRLDLHRPVCRSWHLSAVVWQMGRHD